MKLKVYGGMYDGQNRIICAAPSWAAFHRAALKSGVNVSLYHLKQYGWPTGNGKEIEIATAEPFRVFSAKNDFRREFKRLDLVKP